MNYTPEQLRELADKASRGDFMFADDELWAILRAHADALERVKVLEGLLGMIYDRWEEGTNCYEEPDLLGGYLGKAFQLSEIEEESILSALAQKEEP